MDNKSFDDILRQSMDTPREFEFDEGAWNRMEERLPQSKFQLAGWWKFMPFMVAILGLMGWNLSLQHQIKTIGQHSNSSITYDTIVHKEYIYQVDTIYQIQEKKIYHYISSSSNDEQIAQAKAKNLDESLTYSPSSFSNNNVSELESDFSKEQKLADLISSFSKKNTRNSFSQLFEEKYSLDSENVKTLANAESRFSKKINKNTNTESLTAKINGLSTVEYLPFSKFKVAPAEINTEEIDELVLVKNKKDNNKSNRLQELRREIKPKEFRIGTYTSTYANGGSSYSIAGGYGIHGGVNIFRDISIEANFSRMTNSSIKTYWDLTLNNPYPHLDYSQIPANYSLYDASITMDYWQFSLGLRKTWFKHEHIRPYVEGGWVVIKPFQGSINYSYGLNNQIENFSSIPINSSNTNLHWRVSPIFFGTGLSSKLWRERIIFDFGLRYMVSLNGQQSIYESNVRDAIGVNMSFSYQFGKSISKRRK